MPTFSQRITDLLITWRIPLFLLAVAGAMVVFFPARRIAFDRSIENMFAPDDPLLVSYKKLKRTFGGNEIVLAVYVDDELLHPDGRGMRRLAEISEKFAAVPGVKAVVSLDQPLGPAKIVEPLDPLAERVRKLFEGYTHGADGKTAAVVCMLTPESNSAAPPRQKTIDQLRDIARTLPSGTGMITGEPVMVTDGFRYVEEDGRRLGWATTLLLGATIIVCFRSVRWVIVPVAVVQLALLLTRAVLVWSGLRLSMVSSMLTAIVTVVGVATVVHVIVRFREARLNGLPPREALSRAGRLLGAPIFWACSTTAVGFASLTTAQVGPIQDFGMMMAIGAVAVMVSVALVLPALVLLGRFDTDPKRAWGEKFLDSGLGRLVGWVERRPKTLGLATLLLAATAAAGVFRLEIETDFTRNFRAKSPIVQSYQFVETNLGGAGMWDVVLPAQERLAWDDLRKVRRLEDRLRNEVLVDGPTGEPTPGLTKVLSLDDALIAHSPKVLGKVPFGDVLLQVALNRMHERIPQLVEALHGEDTQHPGRYYFRIMLRAKERQPSAQKQEIIQQVEAICQEEFPPTRRSPGAEVTGFFVLLTNLIDSILRDQWVTFGVATAGIGLMMVVALRSPVLAAVALVPNVLPIVIVTGLTGWLGLKINMGAAMIAAVSMGLSIDSSIHYIIAFRRALGEGKKLQEAIADVHQSVGRAMVFSTLALIVGFTVLATSQFVPTIYFGVLVSLAMLGGLAGNLVVLPLLLKLVTPKPQ